MHDGACVCVCVCVSEKVNNRVSISAKALHRLIAEEETWVEWGRCAFIDRSCRFVYLSLLVRTKRDHLWLAFEWTNSNSSDRMNSGRGRRRRVSAFTINIRLMRTIQYKDQKLIGENLIFAIKNEVESIVGPWNFFLSSDFGRHKSLSIATVWLLPIQCKQEPRSSAPNTRIERERAMTGQDMSWSKRCSLSETSEHASMFYFHRPETFVVDQRNTPVVLHR